MQCPVCSVDLMMSERQGVEIDYCPKCRGVWLDRGELDKIIEKSSGDMPQPQYQTPSAPTYHQPEAHSQQHYQKPYKKKESFLTDLFDF